MPLSLDELKQELADLESGSFVSLTDTELRERIRLIHGAFILKAPTYPVGTLIYRAVKISERPSHRSRITYPPVNLIKTNGRLNRVGEGCFMDHSINLPLVYKSVHGRWESFSQSQHG